MMQKEHVRETKGSQYWIRRAVNGHTDILRNELKDRLSLGESDNIEWVSPLENDEYREYADDLFLEKLGIELKSKPLRQFWPKGGPRWDALGKTSKGQLLLIEAKAHISEILSPRSGAQEKSLTLIKNSLDETRHFLGATSKSDWTQTFYQYTNRLAHLYLLRELNGFDAWLVFVHFLNAADVEGPATKEEWVGAISLMHSYLGINNHKLSPYVIDLFIDTNRLT
jgi:hypothetical protein